MKSLAGLLFLELVPANPEKHRADKAHCQQRGTDKSEAGIEAELVNEITYYRW